MIKIYTPKEWFSYFNHNPYIIVDDNGLIYTEEEWNKWARNPIGMIDFAAGKVYGDDYNKLIKNPIGMVRVNHGVTEIYADNYYKFGAKPVLCIKDNKLYDYDEFQRITCLHDNPKAFIETMPKSGNMPSGENKEKEIKETDTRDGDHGIPTGFIILFFGVAAFVGAKSILSGSMEPSDWYEILGYMILGIIPAYFFGKGNYFTTFVIQDVTSGLGGWLVNTVLLWTRGDFWDSIVTAMLGWVLFPGMLVLPSLVIALIIVLLYKAISKSADAMQ